MWLLGTVWNNGLTFAAGRVCCLLCAAAGGTAFISETGLGIDRLRVCNLSSTAFSGCQSFSGFGASGLRSAYAEGNTVW